MEKIRGGKITLFGENFPKCEEYNMSGIVIFICVCNPYKINILWRQNKLFTDISKNNFILIVDSK
jgi:hypothetical protein